MTGDWLGSLVWLETKRFQRVWPPPPQNTQRHGFSWFYFQYFWKIMSRCHGKGLALVILLTSMQLVSQQVFLLPMRFPAEVKLIEVENLALAGDFGNEYVGRMKETLGTISTHATLHTDDGVTWDSFMRERCRLPRLFQTLEATLSRVQLSHVFVSGAVPAPPVYGIPVITRTVRYAGQDWGNQKWVWQKAWIKWGPRNFFSFQFGPTRNWPDHL